MSDTLGMILIAIIVILLITQVCLPYFGYYGSYFWMFKKEEKETKKVNDPENEEEIAIAKEALKEFLDDGEEIPKVTQPKYKRKRKRFK